MNVFDLEATIKLNDEQFNSTLVNAKAKMQEADGGVKGLIGSLGKFASAAAVAFAVKKVVDFTGAIVEAYGRYEQLVGGVDTLFEESSGKLKEYASQAYKTAGISANQYMEQATSFAASLTRALGGDTQKAVEYANMAITDMADNANKMGTPLESIQNVYQALAKGNATLVDNLKLGYGGTQTEMLKLAKDMGVVDEKINSFADMSFDESVLAIHKLQEELKITGTTTTEAATTIEGSIGQMKASFENFMTGLGNEEANLDQLTTQLIDSVLTVGDNLLPVIDTILNNLADSVIPKLPEIIGKILPPLLEFAVGMIPKLVEIIPQLIMSIVDALISNIPAIIDAGIQLLGGLISAIPTITMELIKRTPQIVVSIVKGIIQGIGSMVQAGKDLLNGLWNGIWSKLGEIKDKVVNVGKSILGWLKGGLDEHSPSKATALMGRFLDEGLAIGIDNNLNKVKSAVNNMVGVVPTELSTDMTLNQTTDLKNQRATEQSKFIEFMDLISPRLVEIIKMAIDGSELDIDRRTFARLVNEV